MEEHPRAHRLHALIGSRRRPPSKHLFQEHSGELEQDDSHNRHRSARSCLRCNSQIAEQNQHNEETRRQDGHQPTPLSLAEERSGIPAPAQNAKDEINPKKAPNKPPRVAATNARATATIRSLTCGQ
ncbi:hypothetical protein [Stenotrophomonas sp.]|uniref:hypothetical protein n=1 Tax=Stenotrophomonas sp. TaxID=69392 RepID=UPI0028A8CCCD|nr:hypothetical protein [Stenotrophomonas sp.]